MSGNPEFDPTIAEDALQAYMNRIFGGGLETFESSAVGVVAFERLSGNDDDKVDWDALATEMSRAAGFPVACIANADWSLDGRCDEEATFVAFQVPGVDPDYLESSRNKLSGDYLDALEAAPGGPSA